MRGRQVFFDSLIAHGATHIFGNPGTTENPLLEALADNPEVTYITALHEGVAVCAANFFAQASGRTAVANVHVAPGLGNAIGMMYAALKTRVPVVVTAGQQDTRLRLREPLLRHDLVAMAAPVTKWAAEPQNADEIGPIMRRAFQIANQHPKGPVFVALPNNVMEQETQIHAQTSGVLHTDATPNEAALHGIAEQIVSCQRIVLLPGDDVAAQNATEALAAFAVATGAEVYTDVIPARLPIGADHPHFCGHVSMEAERLSALLAEFDLAISIGGITLEEIWYDDAELPANTTLVQIEATEATLAKVHPVHTGIAGHLARTLGSIQALCAEIDAETGGAFQHRVAARNDTINQRHHARQEAKAARLQKHSGQAPMTPLEALHTLAQGLPHDVVLVDEAITASEELERALGRNDPLQFFAGRGGGIGLGLAGAVGAAVGLPEARIVAVSGDGSAMYSIQALWSAAHHNLRILFVILANAEYRVLKHNMDAHRARFNAPTDQPYPRMDLTGPALGFVDMARGMGVPASRATTPEDIAQATRDAMAIDGPYLLEIAVQGKER